MKNLTKRHWFLILLFAFILAIRLYFSLSVSHFSTDESYFGLRMIQNFIGEGSISFLDPLSYGGRELVYSPLFYLIFGVLSLGSVLVMKILSEVLFASLVFIIYALAYRYTANAYVAFLTTLFTNFVPLFMAGTLNVISPYALVLPLFFIMFYALMNLDKPFYQGLFLVASIILPLLHVSAFLFLITILLFFFLLQGGALHPTKKKKEILFVSFFSILLIGLIVYKRALMKYGLGVIWENLPLSVLADAFRSVDVLSLIFAIGLVPLILGLIGLYFGVIREKNKHVYMLGAFMLGVLFALLLQLFPFSEGLMFLGLLLGVLSAITLNRIWIYAGDLKSKYLGKAIKFVFVFVIPIFVIFGTIGFITDYEGVSSQTVSDLAELKGETYDVVAANLNEGNMVASLAGKKNIADTNFLLAPRPIDRINDLDLLYLTGSKAVAYEIINKYGVDVILLSEKTKILYDIEGLKYAEENECLERKQNIYVVKCTK